MKLTVDRIEENIIVCETEEKEMIEVEASKFNSIPKAGDIVELNDEGMYETLKEETEVRTEEIRERFTSLFKKN